MNARTGKELKVTKIEMKTCPVARAESDIDRRATQDTHERNRVRQKERPRKVKNGENVAFFEASSVLDFG